MANQVYLSIKYQGINPNSRPESLIQYKQEDVEEEGANIQEFDLIDWKKKKAVVTWTSQAVPHLSTNHA
jgi:hypothetical protein